MAQSSSLILLIIKPKSSTALSRSLIYPASTNQTTEVDSCADFTKFVMAMTLTSFAWKSKAPFPVFVVTIIGTRSHPSLLLFLFIEVIKVKEADNSDSLAGGYCAVLRALGINVN